MQGKESFNEKYMTVWEKRFRQTGKDSPKGHVDNAANKRKNTEKWIEICEAHAETMEKMGVAESDIPPTISWTSS